MPSRRWPEYPYGCRFRSRRTGGEKKPVHFGNEERSACARNCRDARQSRKRLGVEHVEKTVAASHVNAATPRIEEYVVGVPARFDLCNGCAVLHGKYPHLRGIAKHDDD